MCPACKERLKKAQACAHCGTYSLFTKSDAKAGIHEPICIRCRTNARITCPSCHKHRRPAALDAQGKQICKECHERGTKKFICPQCGKRGVKHSKSRCEDCYWAEYAIKSVGRCQSLLSNKWTKSCFADFIQSLIEIQSSNYAAMKVERYFPFFAKLDSMFNSLEAIDAHILLDHLGPDGLRRFTTPYDYLAKAGLITPLTRDEIYAHAEFRSHNKLVSKADGRWYEKNIISFYEHLQTLAKRYADRGWTENKARFKPRTITSALRAAILFFDHVDACRISSISQIQQCVVDDFIFHNPGYKNALRLLIRYINRHGKVFRKLKIENRKANISQDSFISPKKYGELINHWLACDGKDTKKALIGIFMLMYAQPATSIVKLRMSDVLRSEGGKYKMVFGSIELDLDPRIGNLFDRYLEHRHSLSMMDSDLHNEWLFPGRKYGCHITTAAISEMIKQFGVSADQMFATAIFNAYQTGMRYPNVLVRALGITNATAIKYLQLIDPRMFDEAEGLDHSYA